MSPRAAARPLIAVIEDDEAVLHSLEYALTAQGYRVSPFACAQDALDGADIMRADCLLIDYTLPDFDGLTMLAVLRDRGLSCPAIIIASNPNFRCRKEAAKAGAPLLEKPVMGNDLVDKLRSLVKGPAG
jgi:FixJ family two-component response regulator